MGCRFKSCFINNYSSTWKILFPFEQCYEEDTDGYWRYSADRATEDAFENFKVDSMPTTYLSSALEVFQSNKSDILIA